MGQLWNSKLPSNVLGNDADHTLTLSSAREPDPLIILLLSATVADVSLKCHGARKKPQPQLLRHLGHSEGGRFSDLLGSDED